MARGKVIQWDAQRGIGFLTDTADGARVFFGDRGLRGLRPGDVRVGLEVEFDRADTDRGPAARNVRPVGAAAPTGGGGPRPPRAPQGGGIPLPPREVPVPRSLQALLARVPP